MRVLIINPHIFPGGAEKAVVHLAHQLALLGCETAVATLSLDLSDMPSFAEGVQYLLPRRPIFPGRVNSVTEAAATVVRETLALRKILEKHAEGFDLLNPCNVPSYWATYPYRGKKPIVWTSSEVFGSYGASKDAYDNSRLFRLAFKLGMYADRYLVRKGVDGIVTCSRLNQRLIQERYGMTSQVIPPGVNYEFFQENHPDPKGALGLDGSFVLLHVGALIRRKNHILSVEALQRLKGSIPEAKLIIVGRGPRKRLLERRVSELGLDKDVILLEQVSEETLKLIYHACDVNLFSVEDQTYGLVPFEALAAGKPSIVSEGCGAADIIREEKIGVLVNPGVESLVRSILYIRENPGWVEDMVRRGQGYARENLSWRAYAIRMLQFFKEALDATH